MYEEGIKSNFSAEFAAKMGFGVKNNNEEAKASGLAKLIFRSGPQRAYEKALESGPYDAVIVPGVPYNDHSLSKVMEGRVKWACYLYRKGLTNKIIFSGAAVYTPYYEAKVMALYAQAWGVPEKDILVDTVAEHSTENVYYSYQLAIKYGLKKLAVATDPFQTLMAKQFINNRYLDIASIPMVFSIMDSIAFRPVSIDDASAQAPADFRPLPEREGFIKRFLGTLGARTREGVY